MEGGGTHEEGEASFVPNLQPGMSRKIAHQAVRRARGRISGSSVIHVVGRRAGAKEKCILVQRTTRGGVDPFDRQQQPVKGPYESSEKNRVLFYPRYDY